MSDKEIKIRKLPRLPKVRGESQRRVPKTGAFSPLVDIKINDLAQKWYASRSYVIVTIVSKYFDLKKF